MALNYWSLGRYMDKKIKVLFISAPFSGIEIFQRNLYQVISKRNDIESMWSWVDGNSKKFMVNLYPLCQNWSFRAGMIAKSMIKEYEKNGEQFDAVFINHLTPLTFIREFRRRVPTILSLDVTPHLLADYSSWYQYKKKNNLAILNKYKHRITQRAYNDAAFLLPWSKWVSDSLVNDYGISPEKIEIIPPGINLQQWGRTVSKAKRSSGKIKILFVGGEYLRKGGDTLFSVASRQEFHNCEFHFVTRDFKGSPLSNTFFYDTMEANSEPLRSLYAQADIFVLPTRADFSPNAICEAMAFELPVITTNVGSLNETVQDNENGYFIPVGNEQVLADRLLKLTSNKALCHRMGKEGKKLVDTKYNLEKNAERIIYHLKRVALAKKERTAKIH